MVKMNMLGWRETFFFICTISFLLLRVSSRYRQLLQIVFSKNYYLKFFTLAKDLCQNEIKRAMGVHFYKFKNKVVENIKF